MNKIFLNRMLFMCLTLNVIFFQGCLGTNERLSPGKGSKEIGKLAGRWSDVKGPINQGVDYRKDYFLSVFSKDNADGLNVVATAKDFYPPENYNQVCADEAVGRCYELYPTDIVIAKEYHVVQVYYKPVDGPDGYMVMAYRMDGDDVLNVYNISDDVVETAIGSGQLHQTDDEGWVVSGEKKLGQWLSGVQETDLELYAAYHRQQE